MATHNHPPAMLNNHPTSPPMTPCPSTHACFPSQTANTSPFSNHTSAPKLAHTPPLEFIEPTGQGCQFNFTRPQSFEPSSRPSSESGPVYAITPQESESEDGSDEENYQEEEEKPIRRVDNAEFVLEELDNDPGYDSSLEVVQPDHFEDAKSEKSAGNFEVIDKLKELILEETSSDEERERKYRHKKKRWRAGVFKRTHSQSLEGDSSYFDNDPMDDIDPNARRLRRRIHGTFDRRGPLIFKDEGFANTNNILEIEEPEEGMTMHPKGSPSISSDDVFTLDELPFWRGSEDSMDVEFDSN